jgi:hypothetical protein
MRGKVEGSDERGNEPLSSFKCGECLDHLSESLFIVIFSL